MIVGSSTPLPNAPEGWSDYQYAVLSDGDLGILRVPATYHEHQKAWHATRSGEPPPRSCMARLTGFDGWTETPPLELPLEDANRFDRTAEGQWLTASARARSGEANGRIHDASGAVLRTMVLGDAIEHLRCAPDGTLWVGYFDEALAAGRPSTSGIAHFSSEGELLWGINGRGLPWMLDCYGLTLDRDLIWSCYYTDFPIVRIDGEDATVWTNEDVRGADALAIDGRHVLLAGTYDDPARLSLMTLSAGEARLVGQTDFEVLHATPEAYVQGRGDVLHIIAAGAWTRVKVREVRQALGIAR